MSVPPPGARGTTSLMGSEGYLALGSGRPRPGAVPAVEARSLRLPIMSKNTFLPPPLGRAFARERQARLASTPEIDQYLGDRDRRARRLPAPARPRPILREPLSLQQRLHPEGRPRQPSTITSGAVLLDGGDSIRAPPRRACPRCHFCTAAGSRSAWIGRSLGWFRAGQGEIDVADRGATLGHAVLHDQMIHLHVMRFSGDVDDAELVCRAGPRWCICGVRRRGDRGMRFWWPILAVTPYSRDRPPAQQHDSIVLAAGRQASRTSGRAVVARPT